MHLFIGVAICRITVFLASTAAPTGIFAAIGPVVNLSSSDPAAKRFLTRAEKFNGPQPFFTQGSLPVQHSNDTVHQQWEQHITPFPSVIYNEAWSAPLGPYRLYYAVQTDCMFRNGESKFATCKPNSCAIALATSTDGE